MAKYRQEALDKFNQDQEAQNINKANLKKRLAQLASMRRAKESTDSASLAKTEELKKKESDDLARAMQDDDLNPAKVYQILSERHLAEMKALEENFLREKEIEKATIENEIKFQRENLRNHISDPEQLEIFDKETAALVLASNDPKKDQLELFERKNELKMKQMKEIEDILTQFDPETAMRLQVI